MTDRERQFASLGIEYAEGIDRAAVVTVPSTGRKIRKTPAGTWECQPWNDNYWKEFDDLLDALRFASRPTTGPVCLEAWRNGEWTIVGQYHSREQAEVIAADYRSHGERMRISTD